MTEKDIKQLVTRFMEGETSLDEERRLADYFRSHPNEPGMEDIASMFALFDTGMPIEGVTDVQPKAHSHRRITRHPAWWASVAAVAVVFVAFTFSIRYLTPRHEEATTHIVCQVSQPVTTQQPKEEESAAQAEPMAETAAKSALRITDKPIVAQTKPKAQSETAPAPVPEMLPDSVVEAALMQQRIDAQIKYKQQMLAQEQAERELQQQAKLMEAVAEYVANMEYVETIQVW